MHISLRSYNWLGHFCPAIDDIYERLSAKVKDFQPICAIIISIKSLNNYSMSRKCGPVDQNEHKCMMRKETLNIAFKKYLDSFCFSEDFKKINRVSDIGKNIYDWGVFSYERDFLNSWSFIIH